jgi:hypothetical protein
VEVGIAFSCLVDKLAVGEMSIHPYASGASLVKYFGGVNFCNDEFFFVETKRQIKTWQEV